MILPPNVQRKIDLLQEALDYPSDAEAARHLGTHRTTLGKYRRQLNFSSSSNFVDGLNRRPGRKRRMRVGGSDPEGLIRWIGSENPDWTPRQIAAAMRDLGHRRTTISDVRAALEKKYRPSSKRRSEEFTVEPDEAGDVLLEFVKNHPVRALAVLVEHTASSARNALSMARTLDRLEGGETPETRRTKQDAKKDLSLVKDARSLIKTLQGRGIKLEDSDFVARIDGEKKDQRQ